MNGFLRIRHCLQKIKIIRFRVDAECRTDHWVRARVPATIGHCSKWHTNRVLGNIRIVSDCRGVIWESALGIISVYKECCLDGGWLRECDLPKLKNSGCTHFFGMYQFSNVKNWEGQGSVDHHHFTVTACTCCLACSWPKWALFC